MKNWKNRSLLTRLLGGALATLLLLGLLWAGTAEYFLGRSDAADTMRWAVDDLEIQFLAARHAEQDFLLTDLRKDEFYKKGSSERLVRHRALMAAIFKDLDRLGGQQDRIAGLRPLLERYDHDFQALVAAYREKGFRDWGVEGEWRKTIHAVEQQVQQTRDPALEVALLQLRRNEKDYLLRGDDKYVEAVRNSLRRLAEKIRGARDADLAAPLLVDLQAYEQAFAKYLAIEEKIGKSEGAGLQGGLRRVAEELQPLLDGSVQQAVRDSQDARRKLTLASAFVLVLGLGLAALLFRYMIGSLSALVEQVQKSSIQMNTSVTEIAATAKEQQATATEIAATTTEIGATSREISATSKELVKTMHEVATGAEHSASLAGSSQTGLAHMEETMHNVMEAASTINAKLAVLNEKAGNITQVVTTIT